MNFHGQQSLTPYEQRLRDEVIYLHSLWHHGHGLQVHVQGQGPSFSQNSSHFPHHFYPSAPGHQFLHVSNPIPFKNTRRRRYKPLRNPDEDAAAFSSRSDPPPAAADHHPPGPEWPVKSTPFPPSPHSWPSRACPSPPAAQPLSDAAGRSEVASLEVQQKIVKCCKEFFSKTKRVDSDSQEDSKSEDDGEVEDEDEDEDGENECLEDECDVEMSGVFKFLLGLFVESQELRDLYEKSQQDIGDLYCLVCGGMRVKVWKKFKGCVSLVQHASAISKTKRKSAHRAFAQVICRVLGWDVTRIPMIVLRGQPLSCSLQSSCQTKNLLEKDGGKEQCEEIHDGMLDIESNKEGAMVCLGDPKDNADCGNEDSNAFENNVESFHGNSVELASEEDSDIHQRNNTLMRCEHVDGLDGIGKGSEAGTTIFQNNLSEGGYGTIICNAGVEEPGIDGPKLAANNWL